MFFVQSQIVCFEITFAEAPEVPHIGETGKKRARNRLECGKETTMDQGS